MVCKMNSFENQCIIVKNEIMQSDREMLFFVDRQVHINLKSEKNKLLYNLIANNMKGVVKDGFSFETL